MHETRNHAAGLSRLRILAALAVVAFGVTLAVVVANRLSDEALAVLAGAVCGVGAAIPTSLLIVAVTRRRDEPREQRSEAYRRPYPPVVVVTPPTGQYWSGERDTFLPSWREPLRREFTVVGGLPTDAEMVTYEL